MVPPYYRMVTLWQPNVAGYFDAKEVINQTYHTSDLKKMLGGHPGIFSKSGNRRHSNWLVVSSPLKNISQLG